MPTRRNPLLADSKLSSGISALARAVGPHPEDEMRGALMAQQQQLAGTQNQLNQGKIVEQNRKNQIDSYIDRIVPTLGRTAPDGRVYLDPKGVAQLVGWAYAQGADPTPLIKIANSSYDEAQKHQYEMELQAAKPLSESEAKGKAFGQMPPDLQRAATFPPVETSAGATQSLLASDPRAPAALGQIGATSPVADAVRAQQPISAVPGSVQFTAPVQQKTSGPQYDIGSIRKSHAANLSTLQQIDDAIAAVDKNKGAFGGQNVIPAFAGQYIGMYSPEVT